MESLIHPRSDTSDGFDNCPYAGVHGATYDSDIHFRQTDPLDSRIGLVNGIRTKIASYSHGNDDYDMKLRFLAFTGATNAGELCIKARAFSAKGTSSAYAVMVRHCTWLSLVVRSSAWPTGSPPGSVRQPRFEPHAAMSLVNKLFDDECTAEPIVLSSRTSRGHNYKTLIVNH